MRATLLILALALSGCGKDKASPRGYASLTDSLADAQVEAARVLGTDGSKARAAWNEVAGSEAWTSVVLAELQPRRFTLERARDLGDFCPGYWQATSYQRDTCFLRLLSAMARFESHFRPDATFLEATGRTSVGLLMMNPEHCPEAPTVEKLEDPAANIRCAVARLNLLVQRDGWLSGQGNLGGAAYWSVLRAPYQSGAMYLGRKPHIELFTRTYRGYRETVN